MQYNQSDRAQHVRIGNWYEELELKKSTGIRYFPSLVDKTTSLMTKDRCITHSDSISPYHYLSTSSATIGDPRQHAQQIRSARVGPRNRLLDEFRNRIVDAETTQRNIRDIKADSQMTFDTEMKSKFISQSKQPGKASRLRNGDDNAITIYSQSFQNGGDFAVPSTFIGSLSRPFARNSAFSTSIRESFENPLPQPSTYDAKNLLNFRSRLINHGKDYYHYPGQTVKGIINLLLSCADENGECSLRTMEEKLQSAIDFNLSISDKRSIVTSYGNVESMICVSHVCDIIRRRLSDNRSQLVQNAFRSLVGDDEFLSTDKLKNSCKLPEVSIHELICHGEPIRLGTFMSFCADISAEFENDDDFEAFLVDFWSI